MSAALALQYPGPDPGANLCRSELRAADLRGADLRDLWLTAARLSQADLQRARLSRADLTDARLAGADLRAVDLREATLAGADLRGADLRGAVLQGADLTEARWDARTRWPEGFRPAEHPELAAMEAAPRPVRRALPRSASWLAALAVIFADQALKDAARTAFASGQAASALVPGALSFTCSQNQGALFGLLPGGGPLLLIAGLAAVIALAAWQLLALRSGRISGVTAAGALLVLGGGVSNLIDRVWMGAVTDCLALPGGMAFNLADVAILAGLLILNRAPAAARGRKPAF